ncbi:FimV/HubP family polar landmark protein, partial [Massilia glaciei]
PAPAPAPAVMRPAPQPAAAGAPPRDTDEVAVKHGDTLGRIAARVKPAEISLDLMLVALYRANPDAFIGNNMNRLKAGRILTVPDAGAVRAIGQGEAKGVVVAHAADFNAYRNKLASQVAAAAPATTPAAAQSGTGKIIAKVEQTPTAASASKDQLKLSKANAAAAAAAAEDKIAKQRALDDAAARVKELERNVKDLEKLVAAKAAEKAAADAAARKAKAAPVVVAPNAAVLVPAGQAVVVAPAATVKPIDAPVTVAVAPPIAAPVAPPVATPVPPPPVAVAPAKKSVKIVTTPAPAPEPGIVDLVIENMYLILGALLALGAAVFLLLKRRAKEEEKPPSERTILGAPTDQAHSLFAETGGQSIDTANSVFNSSFAPSASQLDTNEVDPVAEADVYIAYGRDAQAEEILREALRTHPERYPVRLKLLEIYAARKDQRAFESQASEVYSMSKGLGEDWAQAAALGMSIDPMNPLYASAVAAPADAAAQRERELNAAAAGAGAAAAAADMDLDLDLSPNTVTPAEREAMHADVAGPESTLDFDVGGMSFEPEPAPAAAPDLLFAATPVVLEKTPEPKPDTNEMAFDMDFGLPDTPTVASKSAETAEFDMGDLSKAFDLPGASPAPAPVMDMHSMDFDIPTSSPAPAPAVPQFDMSGLDLDLPGSAGGNGLDFDAAGGDATEMETKLDLAIAYQEIGDKEGACELLDEVIKGGNPEQAGKATAMRAKLA